MTSTAHDPDCGMDIDPATVVGTSEYTGKLILSEEQRGLLFCHVASGDQQRGFHPTAYMEFAQNVRHIVFDCLLSQV